MSETKHNSLWEQYKRAALFARKYGQHGKAARILRDAFREAEEFGELHSGLIAQANALAEAYLSHHRYAEAETIFRMVVEVKEKLLGQTHADVVESLKKVAIVQIMAFRAEALGRQKVAAVPNWSDPIAAAS